MFTTVAQVILCSSFFFQHSLSSSQTPSRVVWDITQTINEFQDNKISKEDFVATISSRKSSNVSEYTMFYNFGTTQRVNDVVNKMWQVSKILNETAGPVLPLQLITFWEITKAEREILIKLSGPNFPSRNQIYHFPNIELSMVIDHNKLLYNWEDLAGYLKLSHFCQVLGISKNQNMRLGFGINPRILYNSERFSGRVNLNTTDVSFITYTATLANPLEIEDSFNYFEEKTRKAFSGLELAYRPLFEPTPALLNYSGFDLHTIYCDDHGTSIILQVRDPAENKISKRQKFSVIPHIKRPNKHRNWVTLDTHDLKTMLTLALEAETKGFNVVLLNYRQWLQLNSHRLTKWLSKYKSTAATPLQVNTDFSETGVSLEDFLEFEKHLKNMASLKQSQQTRLAVLNAFVLGLEGNESLGYVLNIAGLQKHLADLPTELKIGCALQKNSFLEVNATKVVDACKNIGANLYILKLEISLNWHPESSTILQKSHMSKLLEPILKLRNDILNLHQNASVYFQLEITGVNQVITNQVSLPVPNVELSHSIFCQPVLQEINRLFVSIISWANGYNFPVIVNSALTADSVVMDNSGEWLSFLRKVPHRSEDIGLQHKGCGRELQYTLPVLHNLNYKPDACVDWNEGKPEITIEYFNNDNIGTIFRTDDVNHNGTTVEDVIHIMLQFIFHTFRLVEFVASSNFQPVLLALSSVMEDQSAVNSTIFVNYVVSENQTETEFAEFLEIFQESAMTTIKGIHVDLSPECLSNLGLLSEAKHRMSKYLQLQAIFKEKFRDKKLLTKFGISVSISVTDFFELIQFDLRKDAVFDEQTFKLLNKTDYLIFYEDFDFEEPMRKSFLQGMFNKHLNHKRIIQNLFPHLDVYFRVNLDSELKLDVENMDNYLQMLSHFKAFSVANNLSYFIVDAFDNNVDRKLGWWAIKDNADPVDPKSYIEKEASRYMWYPTISIPDQEYSETYRYSTLLIVGLCVALLLLLILITVGSVLIVRYRRRLRLYLSDEEVKEFLKGKNTGRNQSDEIKTVSDAESQMFDDKYELSKTGFTVESSKILGMGNFGTVFKGDVNGVPAAIKQPNKDCPKGTFKSVLTEIKVLCYIGVHSNVVGFIGAYTKEIQQGILFVATELCSNGSLEKLLRTKTSVVSEQEASLHGSDLQENLLYLSELHRFAREIANGMEYIESKNIVHGDLSTRNILLDENLTCKIGDFGLSRKLYEYQKYVKKSQEPLPWKWLAVESLAKMEFTSKSDVWSFGVTIWEIYSLGDSPYAGLNWTVGFVDELRSGLRLAIPQFAAENIYEIMQTCWNLDVEKRPTFTALSSFFRQFGETQYTVLGEQ